MNEHPEAGEVLDGRYRLGERIGRGGMADVFRAEDLRLGREVAVKVFRTDIAMDPQRTTRETELLAGLACPTIVSVLDGAEACGSAYLVMELVDGADLGTLIAAGPVPAESVRLIAADVAEALALLHERNLVHRDVKPGNILVLSDADRAATGVSAKLSDFGIALALDGTRITATDAILGTAAYLSPEQVQGRDVGPASDVYALGLVVVESLTGTRAFPGGIAESAVARLHRPPQLPPDASPELASLLARMTALDPDLRPAAAEVAQEFRGLAGAMTGEELPETAAMSAALLAVPVPAPRLRGPLVAVSSVAAALVMGIGLLLSPVGLPTASLEAAVPPQGATAPSPRPTASPQPPSPAHDSSALVVHAALVTRSDPTPSPTTRPAPAHPAPQHSATQHHAAAPKQAPKHSAKPHPHPAKPHPHSGKLHPGKSHPQPGKSHPHPGKPHPGHGQPGHQGHGHGGHGHH